MENVTAADITQARESLRLIVAAIARGELAARPQLARSLEGALATLNALAEEAVSTGREAA